MRAGPLRVVAGLGSACTSSEPSRCLWTAEGALLPVWVSVRPLLSGPPYSPAQCTRQVASGRCTRGWSPQQTKSFTVDIRAKPEYHKFLIGKGGGKIRKVRDNTGARIIFPTAEDKDQDLITIIGKEDAVREAQKELEALIQNLVRPVEPCRGGPQAGSAGPLLSLPSMP